MTLICDHNFLEVSVPSLASKIRLFLLPASCFSVTPQSLMPACLSAAFRYAAAKVPAPLVSIVTRVTIETNGAGTFAAAYLKAALKQAGINDCGVTEKHEAGSKNKRILEASEGTLTSRKLWSHISVIDGDAFEQMRDWNPATQSQPDDHLDSLAGAIEETPERIGRHVKNLGTAGRNDWRPDAQVHEVTFEA